MTILYFVLAAAALGILVFVHELGHYFVAKKTGMTVEVFSIGFGKPIIKWRWNNVDWQLCWLPFGGYVKIAGMEFGKKDKNGVVEPYEIPNGFFSKSPVRRILVACAGPLANFILAFLLFALIFSIGGREKPFSDFTHIIGWVDPQSELYAQGLRPGDIITDVNDKTYNGSKDLLYAAMMGGKEISLKGYHVNYQNGDETPFFLVAAPYQSPSAIEGVLTTGVSALSSYLIYDRLPDGSPNPLADASPMKKSGIKYGDRLVWADGSYLFSMEQLSNILNDNKSLLTIKRGNHIFLSRQPRVLASDLNMPQHLRNELIDWQYEMQRQGLPRKKEQLFLLPYVINHDGYVEGPIAFIDEESRKTAFPLHSYSTPQEDQLQAGDQILAVDGILARGGISILSLLQQRHVTLIAERNVSAAKRDLWTNEDQIFMQGLLNPDIEKIASGIGLPNGLQISNGYVRLLPVEPKPADYVLMATEGEESLQKQINAKLEAINKIGRSNKRSKAKQAQALKLFEASLHKLILGISLQDRNVNYNPSPLALFGSVFTETWSTLKALITGYLHPKWISGPIGIVQVIHQSWKVGIKEALFWIGAISVNLGVLNLLPIPVLDGGYIFLSLWELITRRRLKAKTMEKLIIPFVVLLIGLLIFLTFQDLSRLF